MKHFSRASREKKSVFSSVKEVRMKLFLALHAKTIGALSTALVVFW